MNAMGYALVNMGNYPGALRILLNGLQIAGDPKNEKYLPPDKYRILVLPGSSVVDRKFFRLQVLSWLHFDMGILYENTGNAEKQLYHYRQALQLAQKTNDLSAIGVINLNLGRLYLFMKKLDSALLFEQNAHKIAKQQTQKTMEEASY